MDKRTLVDQIEVTRDGTLQIRLVCQVVDGATVLVSHYHRTVLEPGVALADQIAAVNAHLANMARAPVTPAEVARIAKIAAAAHTPEVVEAFAQAARRLSDRAQP